MTREYTYICKSRAIGNTCLYVYIYSYYNVTFYTRSDVGNHMPLYTILKRTWNIRSKDPPTKDHLNWHQDMGLHSKSRRVFHFSIVSLLYTTQAKFLNWLCQNIVQLTDKWLHSTNSLTDNLSHFLLSCPNGGNYI